MLSTDNRLTNLNKDYIYIRTGDDLNERNLTLASYKVIPTIFNYVKQNGIAYTFIKSVADYFESFGFHVEEDFTNYKITL